MAVGVAAPVWYAGPLLMGCLFSYFLYGASFIQTVYYFQITPLCKRFAYGLSLVVAVSFFELAHVVFVSIAVFHILAVAIPKGDLSFRPPPASLAIAPLNTILHMLVQGHFALSIRKLGHNSRLWTAMAFLIFALGLVQLGASFAIAYFTSQISRQLGRLSYSRSQATARLMWNVFTIMSDVIITCCLVYLYRVFRKTSVHRGSRTWLSNLILHTMENGVITTVFAALHIIFYIAMPQNLIYLGLAYVNARLYANVLLASLNANRRVQIEAADEEISLTSRMGNIAASTTPYRGGDVVSKRRHSLAGSFAIGIPTGPPEFRTTVTSMRPSMKSVWKRDMSAVDQKVEGSYKDENLDRKVQ